MKSAGEINSNLPHFTGTSAYYKYGFWPCLLTDGTHYLAEAAGCCWLYDTICARLFQALKTRVTDSETAYENTWFLAELVTNPHASNATLTIARDKYQEIYQDIIHTEIITYTDFPLEKQLLYIGVDYPDTDAIPRPRLIIYLPSEH